VTLAVAYRRADGRPEPEDHVARLPRGETAIPAIGGTLRVDRDETGGRLELLLAAAATGAEVRTDGAAAAAPGQLTVLVCDDEAAIRRLVVRVLERDGVRAIVAPDGPAALAAIAATPVDVVLTDHRMAGMSGIELYDRAVEARPQLRTRFAIMSGEPGSDELRGLVERAGVRLLPKPFDVPAIPALVREIARDAERTTQRG
jgi:CheY-like chemotaxis protein